MKAYVPKKGRGRMYAQPSGRPRVMRRPSACTYVRTRAHGARHSTEVDRVKPTVTVQFLLQMRDRVLDPMLRTMKLMKDKKQLARHCPVCGQHFGHGGRCWNRNCTQRGKRINPDFEENAYVVSSHHNAGDKRIRSDAAFCCVVGVTSSQCPSLTGADHKLIARVYGSLRAVVAAKLPRLCCCSPRSA
eukprot:1216015-Amphidinium_carterae.3